MGTRRLPPKPVLVAVVAAEVVLAGAAWRDMSRRDAGQVRGGKRFWRAFVMLNPGNALLYWLAGRRGATTG